MTYPKTFTTTPINDIQSSFSHFDWHWSVLDSMKFNTLAKDEPMDIELIQCKVGTTEQVLEEIAERGYVPAPSPYLLGFGVQYQEEMKDKYIVSLDEQNVLLFGRGRPCFLDLRWDGRRDLFLAERAGRWDGYWWFAVVRKDASILDPNPLDTETLNPLTEETAISYLKEKGFRITRSETKEIEY